MTDRIEIDERLLAQAAALLDSRATADRDEEKRFLQVLYALLRACKKNDGRPDAALLAASCGGSTDRANAPSTSDPRSTTAAGPPIRIGAQSFGENAVLAQIYGQALAAHGYPVSYRPLAGARNAVYAAFEAGAINFTPEYAASALEFLVHNAGEATRR